MQRSTLLLTLFLLSACAGAPVDTTQSDNYFNQHADLMQSLPPTTEQASVAEKYQVVMQDFSKTMTEENLRALYAEELYFNDTFVTLTTLDELINYMTKTAQMAEAQVDILDVARSETDYFIKWSMDMTFNARGKQVRSDSIGVTQVRFNEAGKVVYHQDYWDSANAFYQHLPIVGGLVQRVRNSLH